MTQKQPQQPLKRGHISNYNLKLDEQTEQPKKNVKSILKMFLVTFAVYLLKEFIKASLRCLSLGLH